MGSRLIAEAIFCNFSICWLLNQRQLKSIFVFKLIRNWMARGKFFLFLFRLFPLDRNQLEKFLTSPTLWKLTRYTFEKNVNLFAISLTMTLQNTCRKKSRVLKIIRCEEFPIFRFHHYNRLRLNRLCCNRNWSLITAAPTWKRNEPDRMIWKENSYDTVTSLVRKRWMKQRAMWESMKEKQKCAARASWAINTKAFAAVFGETIWWFGWFRRDNLVG